MGKLTDHWSAKSRVQKPAIDSAYLIVSLVTRGRLNINIDSESFYTSCDFINCCWRSIRGERPAAPGEKESTIRKDCNAGFKEMARFPRFNSHVNNLEHYIVCFWLSGWGDGRVHSLLIWSNDSLQERGGRLPCALYILTFTIHLEAFLKGKHFSIKICIDVHGYGRKFKQEQHLDSFST